MKITHRAYSEETGDFLRLSRFLIEHNPAIRTYSTWCIGRFVDWKYGLYPNKRAYASFCEENAELWFDAFEQLAGFVISENGDGGFTIITLPGYRFLFEQMLAWTLENWGSRGELCIEITQHQPMEAGILAQQGFHQSGVFYTRVFDLSKEPPVLFPLEPGFVIVDMAAHPDYRAQRVMRANAFQGKAELTEAEMQQELLFTDYSHHGPIYHPNTDLCVMAEDGRFVSGCEALIDAHNCEADIERICTHSAFRKRGFARAVIQECLTRLRAMGLCRAYITGYSIEAISLYGSLGAEGEMQAYTWSK
jgi:ribosomal protein S18 acetylase RimI-like enzyme